MNNSSQLSSAQLNSTKQVIPLSSSRTAVVYYNKQTKPIIDVRRLKRKNKQAFFVKVGKEYQLNTIMNRHGIIVCKNAKVGYVFV